LTNCQPYAIINISKGKRLKNMRRAFKITDNKIISLENFAGAEIITSGSGAKSNPYSYTIVIDYLGGVTQRISFKGDKEKCEKVFDSLLLALNAQ
jgi:hypothetical protein